MAEQPEKIDYRTLSVADLRIMENLHQRQLAAGEPVIARFAVLAQRAWENVEKRTQKPKTWWGKIFRWPDPYPYYEQASKRYEQAMKRHESALSALLCVQAELQRRQAAHHNYN